jgi:hypothetical protein
MSKIFGMQILTLFYPRYQFWTSRRLGDKFISALGPQIVCKHPRQVGIFYPQNLWVVRAVPRLFNDAIKCNSSLLSKHIKIEIYRTIILPVVLKGCETWSLTLSGERRLWVFENRVLRTNLGLRETR